ncbi:hypothetical protein K0C01_02445 [Salinarchaeum sp. IM2453]|uniref:hypothetical protein n=1 Tax=Salinarchaeum sp. IM2453 TaxID=2862870 RepID=UPI001C838913|nr:hypothetical protein [Salinarchaeum sp. IM2453]QZA89042.1 hypothetical protein K0C01_02445 [Salinarchaeum sp. IM2453]
MGTLSVAAQEDDLSFDNQATGSTFSDGGTTNPGVVVENVTATQDSAVVVTYEDAEGNTIIAGGEFFDEEELAGDDVTLIVDNIGGFPGEHTAHVIPEDELSDEEYDVGDTVSDETAGAVTAAETATVFQGTLEFADQGFDEELDTDDTITLDTAILDDGEGEASDTLFTVDIHPTDDDGNLVGDEFIGSSDVLVGENDDVTVNLDQVPEDGEFNEFPIDETDEYIAMIHVVDDDDAEEGDAAAPGEYPVLPNVDGIEGPVPGGITDTGTVFFEDAVSFNDQATASPSATLDRDTDPGVIVEDVQALQDSAVVVTYEGSTAVQSGDEVTIDLDNVGSDAWEVNGVSGATDNIEDVVREDEANPTLLLVEGVEYTFEDLPGEAHPLEFQDDEGNALLSQDGDGAFEDDGEVGWNDEGDEVSFTLTADLNAELTTYVCTIHGAMEGQIQTPLTIAGLAEIDGQTGGDVAVEIEDDGGFPGEHTAHLIPTAELSEDYASGDVVSEETAGEVSVAEQATVFQGDLEFADQSFEGALAEGDDSIVVETATLNGDEDTLFQIDVHPVDEEGTLVGDEFVGSSAVLSGDNEDVEITLDAVPEDGTFNELPLAETDDFIAMVHVVDDETVDEGDQVEPGTFPVLQNADDQLAFVPGGITDQATVTINPGLSFVDQATESSTITSETPTNASVVVEDVVAAEDSAVVITYEEGDESIIAGVETVSPDIGGDAVTVELDDTDGFPGEHTAHLIPTDGLSNPEYEAGNQVSSATADAVEAAETATVLQGELAFADQEFDEPVEAGDEIIVETANLSAGVDDDTAFTVDVHPTNDEGELVGTEFVGSSNVLEGDNSDVGIELEQVPEDGAFNQLPLNETDDFVAMIHLVGDDDAAAGDDASPGAFPALQNADAEDGFVPGGVTDDATLTIVEPDPADPGTNGEDDDFGFIFILIGIVALAAAAIALVLSGSD